MSKHLILPIVFVVATLIGLVIGRSIGAQKATADLESSMADLIVASGCTIEEGRIKCTR